MKWKSSGKICVYKNVTAIGDLMQMYVSDINKDEFSKRTKRKMHVREITFNVWL